MLDSVKPNTSKLIFGFMEIGSAIELWIEVEPTPSQKTIASKIKIYFIFEFSFTMKLKKNSKNT